MLTDIDISGIRAKQLQVRIASEFDYLEKVAYDTEDSHATYFTAVDTETSEQVEVKAVESEWHNEIEIWTRPIESEDWEINGYM